MRVRNGMTRKLSRTKVVRDGALITSRKPEDIPVFVAALIATLVSGADTGQADSLRKAS